MDNNSIECSWPIITAKAVGTTAYDLNLELLHFNKSLMPAKMVRNDLHVTIPAFFKCPISLDMMKSPVSLSTGVTYDRSSIQKWLDDGNNTCPATMQVLESRDVTPNYTLRRLIQVWSASNQFSRDSDTPTSSQDSPQHVQDILKDITNGVMESERLRNLSRFANECETNRESLVKAGAVPILADILLIHDLGKESRQNSRKVIEICEEAVKILGLIPQSESTCRILVNPQPLSSIVWLLQNGSPDARIESARLVENLAMDGEMKLLVAAKEGLLEGLLRLSTMDADAKATDAALSCLLSLCTPKRNRLKIIRLGAVGHMSKLLGRADSGTAERALALLELMSACADGRLAISEDPQCIPVVVKKMLKVSESATEHSVIILWAICYLSPDHRARNAVVQSNGQTKILLLMQSNCSPAIRQMAGDLLKIFREISKDRPACYDSKMTHIMPF